MIEHDKKHLRELIADFQTGMLVTVTASGMLRARPMAIAELGLDGDLYFATSTETEKVHEIELNRQAALTLQSSRSWVSVSGLVSIVRDRALIDSAWSEQMAAWFPKGKDDPALCLLQMRPVEAEYWDMKGTKALRYLFESAKAHLTGTTPAEVPGSHGEIRSA